MKQLLQNYRTGELKLEDVPTPVLKPGGVLVKNHYSLVSAGTERAVIEFAKQNLVEKARSRPDLVKQVLNKVKTDGLVGTYHAAMQRLDEPLPLGYSCAGEKTDQKNIPVQIIGEEIIIPRTKLSDKIKGGWAGQVIGCTYGGPTEFSFNGTMIQEYQPIPWYDG